MRDVPGPHAGILVTIRSLLPELAPVEQRLARAVLAGPGGVAWPSISGLARSCGASATSVVRFCRAVAPPMNALLTRALPDRLLELIRPARATAAGIGLPGLRSAEQARALARELTRRAGRPVFITGDGETAAGPGGG